MKALEREVKEQLRRANEILRKILQSTTSHRGVTTECPRDGRRSASKQSSAGANADTLHAQERELLALPE